MSHADLSSALAAANLAVLIVAVIAWYTRMVRNYTHLEDRLKEMEKKLNMLWLAYTRHRGWTGDATHDENFFGSK